VRHAQYRRELADALAVFHPFEERADPSATKPTVTVQWVGTAKSRDAGWVHSYDVEIAVGEHGPTLDELVASVAEIVDTWQPNTSRARPSPPSLRPVTVLDGDINYPAIVVSTSVTEPA
jgi:hypothetical protein